MKVKRLTARELDASHGIPGAVSFRDSSLGGVVAELGARGATAVVALRGGQVLSYVPRGGADALWMSPLARLDGSKAVRGGIPVCWPWFGPHPDDARLPAHGVVRTVDWHVVSASRDGDGVRLRLGMPLGAALADTPLRHLGLTLDVTLGDTLDLALTTLNGGDTAMEITQALHTYLGVGNVAAIRIDGLDGCDFVDKVERASADVERGGTVLSRQAGPVVITREVDRIYVATRETVVVSDPALGRRIAVSKEGSASTVVWNPWIDKAARLGDLGPDGHLGFVCVETANAGTDRCTIAPGLTHVLRATIAVTPRS